MEDPNPIGTFLRARRQLVHPQDAGLRDDGSLRRVPGLRREEVAELAGISTQYYLRLEQGRDRHPSEQVVRALTRALRLDEVAVGYLTQLAHEAPVLAAKVEEPDAVDPEMTWLVESWTETAAVVQNRYLDTIASNRLAQALTRMFDVGTNNLVSLFLDPSVRRLYRDWDGLADRSAELLRAMAGNELENPRLIQIIDELSEHSAKFRQVWANNGVRFPEGGVHILDHPIVGELTLNFKILPLPNTHGEQLFLYFAQPNSPSAGRLAELAAFVDPKSP
ncbi:helix-turn-helix transcriptional regulator [Diaminobutyricibacter sp. McL0618]|uniref:helix-turn-helix transcriptional regulator n=1 Tax=Leifsonia sp. McL0618 TaxID=3415677 RepID=UPI003CE8553B